MFGFDLANIMDVEKIVALVNAAYRGRQSSAGWTSEVELVDGERVDQQQVRMLIHSMGSVVLLMRAQGRSIGCVHVKSQGDIAYIGMLAIDPLFQGKGLGTQLLNYAEEYSHLVFAAKKVELCVITQRFELVDFYRRRGYRVQGEERQYPSHLAVGSPIVDGLTIREMSKEIGLS